ncbi:MAG: helix-turn-helix transcriptional regulator [Bacteroidota bacterium]|jgi:putative transcriptional regulator
MPNVKLVNQIKVQRAIHNLTQEELASKIGVTRKTINTIENGIFVPSTILAIRLAKYFKIKVEDLFDLAEDNTNHEL